MTPRPGLKRYRKVAQRMWSDEKFLALSAPPANAQSLWEWFLTGPRTTNVPGIVVGARAVLAAELQAARGWDQSGFEAAFQELVAAGMVEVGRGFVWLRNALRQPENAPESPNVVKAWASAWLEIPECPLKSRVQGQLRAYCRERGQSFQRAFTEAFGEEDDSESAKASGKPFREPLAKPSAKPSRNQEQEQEQEQTPPPCDSEPLEGGWAPVRSEPAAAAAVGFTDEVRIDAALRELQRRYRAAWEANPRRGTWRFSWSFDHRFRELLADGRTVEELVQAWIWFLDHGPDGERRTKPSAATPSNFLRFGWDAWVARGLKPEPAAAPAAYREAAPPPRMSDADRERSREAAREAVAELDRRLAASEAQAGAPGANGNGEPP